MIFRHFPQTYYYNPLSAGYRVAIPQPQRPSSPFNIRRFQLPNSHRKDDVPPGNFSYFFIITKFN